MSRRPSEGDALIGNQFRYPLKLHTPSFLYPVRGLIHLLTHRYLLPPFLRYVVPLFFLSVFVLTFLFLFTYLPQVALMALFHGPLAWVNAFFMVLNEAALIIAFVAENWMVEAGLVDTFDAILVEKGFEGLVARGREIRHEGNGPVDRLGKYKMSPYLRFSCRLLCEFIMFFPVNFIPVVGWFLFIVLQAYHFGPLAHYRYFQLLGLTSTEKKIWIDANKRRYWFFGIMHLMLQLVPVLSIFFLFTSAAGAALWAVRIEMERGREAEEEV